MDTHSQTHHVAVLDAATGGRLGDHEFAATPEGYVALAAFIAMFGPVAQVGIEGTSSYGAGLAKFLRSAGIAICEVIRPKRAQRRRGKSDPIDAYAAAAAVLSGETMPVAKDGDGIVEQVRAILITRRSAVKARTAAIRQIRSMLVTAPAELRQAFTEPEADALVELLATTLPSAPTTDVTAATLTGLRRLARRYQYLTSEIADAETELDALVRAANLALITTTGFGPVTSAQLLVTAGDNPDRLTSEAAFAALCGAAPIPASSGLTNRYRLNRGGDRQANNALFLVAKVRMSFDPRTKAYVEKKRAEGKSNKEILRCLKRAIARETWHLLVHPAPVPPVDDLRPLRLSLHITLQTVATHFGVWPMTISTIERAVTRNDDLAQRYREWLHSLTDTLDKA